MPIYQYKCSNCNREEEVIQKMNAKPITCNGCGTTMKRLIASNSFHLKGDGWAKDLYHKK